jgi:HSP20 family protein
MDQLFETFLSEWPARTSLVDRRVGSFVPDIDIQETEKEVRVTAELPGLDEKEVEITLTQGALSIKGEKREEHEEKQGDMHRAECRYGMFERTVQLPEYLDADKAKATFKKGVLKVILPKTPEAQSTRRRIPVES